jgi:hypothetical protein
LKTLRQFLHDVVAVRRGDLGAARLKLEQDRLDRRSFLRETKPECSKTHAPVASPGPEFGEPALMRIQHDFANGH